MVNKFKEKTACIIIALIAAIIGTVTMTDSVSASESVTAYDIQETEVDKAEKYTSDSVTVTSQDDYFNRIIEQGYNHIDERTYYCSKNDFSKIKYEIDDYILCQLSNVKSYSRNKYWYLNSDGYYYMTIKFTFRTTAEQDKKTMEEVSRIAAMYNHGSQYDKIKSVFDYLCNTVSYDFSYKNISYSAYGALIEHSSVCEGYASAFKRIMDEMGVTCKIGLGTDHAFNLVLLDGRWYYVDSTMGDQINSIDYFYFLGGKEALKNAEFLSDVSYNELTSVDDYGTANTWTSKNGYWHYYDEDGKQVRGRWMQINGLWYYLDKSGVMQKNCWIDGYYLHSNGDMAESEWLKSGSRYRYVDGSGNLARGWKLINGKYYYFDKQGYMLSNTWLNSCGNRYYLEKSGAMVSSSWKSIGGKWYYFDESGAMKKNCWVGNYYLQSDGSMAVNRWIGRYHVNGNGLWDRTR